MSVVLEKSNQDLQRRINVYISQISTRFPRKHIRRVCLFLILVSSLFPSGRNDGLNSRVRSSPIQNYLFSSDKTRGLGDFCSYQSSPSPGPSPQPPVARSSSTQSAVVPSSSSPVSPGGTLLRQPSHFQQQTSPRNWAPVTPPATSPLPQQHPLLPSRQQQQQQQQQIESRQVSDVTWRERGRRSSAILEKPR